MLLKFSIKISKYLFPNHLSKNHHLRITFGYLDPDQFLLGRRLYNQAREWLYN